MAELSRPALSFNEAVWAPWAELGFHLWLWMVAALTLLRCFGAVPVLVALWSYGPHLLLFLVE